MTAPTFAATRRWRNTTASHVLAWLQDAIMSRSLMLLMFVAAVLLAQAWVGEE